MHAEQEAPTVTYSHEATLKATRPHSCGVCLRRIQVGQWFTAWRGNLDGETMRGEFCTQFPRCIDG